MKLLNPQWLWALALLPVLYGWLVWDTRRRRARFAVFANESVWSAISPELDWGARLRKGRIWLAALAFCLLALTRPQWGMHEESVKITGLDIEVVLDVSNSMEVEDVVPSRLKMGKHLVHTLVDALRGDRVGVVAFAGGAYLACPLTTDLDYAYEVVEGLSPRTVGNQGTDIGLALETATRSLDRAAESQTNHGPAGAASRVVILITDGEDLEGKGAQGAKVLQQSGIKLYVLGVGTSKGGPIPVRDEEGVLRGYKKDPQGESVVSQMRPDDLVKIAAAAGGRYWQLSASESEIQEMLLDMGALNRSEISERKFAVYEDRFQYPLAVAILLFLLEISIPARKRVANVLVLLLSVTTGLSTSHVRAAEPSIGSYLDNKKGLKAYDSEKFDEAKHRFGAAQAADPTRPELQFNQGVVQMREGDQDGAISAFQGAAREALKRGDGALAGRSYFNMADALTKKGRTKEAMQAYLDSLHSAQTLKDKTLEDDARKNLELLAQQKPPQNQSGNGKQDPKDSKDQKKSKEGQDGKDPKDPSKAASKDGKDQQANGQKKFQDFNGKTGAKSFKSEKLSPDDADRVMADLSDKERQLQERLKKQPAQGQPSGKDW